MLNRPRFNRRHFESKIAGIWEKVEPLQFRIQAKKNVKNQLRTNGKFKTWRNSGLVFVSDGSSRISAKTWYELAKVLELN